MITEFGRTALLADDYDDALDFYAGTLDLDVLRDRDLSDGNRAVVVGLSEEA